MEPSRARAVAFDVNETMFSLGALKGAFADVGLDVAQVPLWFARLLRDAFALTALGEYRPFAEIAAETLRDLDPGRVENAAVETVLATMRRLDPHPDVEPALRRLSDGGIPAITLTNGSVETTSALLERAGLAAHIAHVVSVDAVRRLKPAPEPYRHAAAVLGVPAGDLALVAAHPWDCAGARHAGLRAGWVRRGDARWPRVFPPPDATAATLPELVDALLAG
ncbi:MAG: haloacid dehalogenase type II [Micromonosporaceae bacterium]|nr:haloacid dehalogenase type II [Micromonosporaceae bacterium]